MTVLIVCNTLMQIVYSIVNVDALLIRAGQQYFEST